MPKNPAAVALGSLGGKATAAKHPKPTDLQIEARRENAKKATAARVAKAAKRNQDG